MLIFLQQQGMINLDDVRNKMKETERQRLYLNTTTKLFTTRMDVGKLRLLIRQKKREGG